MDIKAEPILVCGRAPLSDSLPAPCSECGETCYATRGSVQRARAEGWPLLCLNCFDKLDMEEVEIAGMLHHGKKLSTRQISSLIDALCAERRHGRKP
jgi:hypothetical protein